MAHIATENEREYRDFMDFIKVYQSLSPLDQKCFILLCRWLMWRPAWLLGWCDPLVRWILFPHWS